MHAEADSLELLGKRALFPQGVSKLKGCKPRTTSDHPDTMQEKPPRMSPHRGLQTQDVKTAILLTSFEYRGQAVPESLNLS